MKRIILLSIILGAIRYSTAFASDTNNTISSCDAEISIRLREPTKAIKTNEPIPLIVRVENLSTNETIVFWVGNGNVPSDYDWTITSPTGNDLSPNQNLPREAISGSFAKIKPLASEEAEYDLSSICKFDHVGTYKVIVRKQVALISTSSERKKCETVSAPLNIVVSK